MKRTRIAIWLIIVSALTGFVFAGTYSGGTGLASDPYQISTADDWQELIDTSTDWGSYFILTANIDFQSVEITPVSLSSPSNFTGVFDGNGHVLSNFEINQPGSFTVGLFRSVDFAGRIKNLGLESFSVTGYGTVGGLVANNNGIITNCYAIGQVSAGQGTVGGLVGSSQGTITRSYAVVDVSGTNEVGGLLGYNDQGKISDSYAVGNVAGGSTFTDTGIGGLCGVNWRGTISRSYATGNVTGYDSVGGLVGRNINAKIVHCYSTGKPTGVSGYSVGGLVGDRWDGSNEEDTGNFWDKNTSQTTTSEMGVGKTTEQMQTISTFTGAGWDFLGESSNGTVDSWRMCVDGADYPRLRWEFSRAGDLDCPDGIDLEDLAYLVDRWLQEGCGVLNDCGWADINRDGSVNLRDFAVVSDNWLDGLPEPIPDITWISITDPGFNGEMSCYPTTNAQYALYLNSALKSGHIVLLGSTVRGASGTTYSNVNLHRLDGPGYTGRGATHGGASRIKYIGDQFLVDGDFENHPVTYISWYGARAFADYYGWRLPTDAEWEAAANFTDGRVYATGYSLYYDHAFFANYRANGDDDIAPNESGNRMYHPWVEHGTSEVGYFGTFGYGLADMSGNVSEWTSTVPGVKLCGGSWFHDASDSTVSSRVYRFDAGHMEFFDGFRVCR